MWCEACESKVEEPGPSGNVHVMAREYAQDLAPSILDKPKEWRRHLLAALREHMCFACGDITDGICHCENDE